MNLNEHHVAVLTALRAAEALRREPATLTPDGHHHWFSLMELVLEGRLVMPGQVSIAVNRAARGLYKNQLLLMRTIHTVVRYCLTDDGRQALAAYDAAHGLTGLREAEMALSQAFEDEWQAENALKAAKAAVTAARVRVADERDKQTEANGL